MTTYRFRVKHKYDSTSLWREIVVGADRTLDGFQTVLNRTVGLNQDHLWFFGTDQDYCNSNIQYKCPGEIKQSPVCPIFASVLCARLQVFAGAEAVLRVRGGERPVAAGRRQLRQCRCY